MPPRGKRWLSLTKLVPWPLPSRLDFRQRCRRASRPKLDYRGPGVPKFAHDQCAHLVAELRIGEQFTTKSSIDLTRVRPSVRWARTDGSLRFLLIASGKVPPAVWDDLGRRFEEKNHTRYLAGNDSFTQYLDGLWLDDHETLMGLSARNMAFAQVDSGRHQWLAGVGLVDRSRYCFPGRMRAGHSGLSGRGRRQPARARKTRRPPAARRLHRFNGSQVPPNCAALSNCKTNPLLFLSLANYLQTDVSSIAGSSKADPARQQRGRQLVGDYRLPAYGPNVAVLNPEALPDDLRLRSQKSLLAHRFDDWKTADWQDMNADNALRKRLRQ